MFKAIKEFFFGKPAVTESEPVAPYKVEAPVVVIDQGMVISLPETAPVVKAEPAKKAPAKRKPVAKTATAKKPTTATKKPAARKPRTSK